MANAVYIWGAIAAALVATGAVLRWLAGADRRLHRTTDVIERMGHLLDPEDGGPGLAERLRTIENRTQRIESELHPNGGSTTRDALNRVEQGLESLNARLPPAAP